MNFDHIRGLYYAIRLAMNPNNTEMVFKMGRAVRNPATKLALVSGLRENAEVAAVLDAKPQIPRLSLERLQACPKDSLGAATLDFLTTNNLDPGIFPNENETDDFSYFRTRMGHTHDIRHVLTGFGTDLVGEIAVQAFDLAQIRQPLPAVIIGMALMKSAVDQPQNVLRIVQAIVDGFTLGTRAKNLFGIDFDAFYDRPLLDVRRELFG